MPILNDEQWGALRHAYGEATDIPDLLRQLAAFPPGDDYRAEPYLSLWSALCHQGDVYPASYAAVPEIVELMEATPTRAHWSALLLVVSIEIARSRERGPEITADHLVPYNAAFERIPSLVAAIAVQQWDERMARVAAAAIAVSKNQTDLAAAILELEPTLVPKFMEWVVEQ